MLVDLIDKAMSRAIQLVKQRDEQNAALHRDFLEPTQKAFEDLHKEYISTFRVYKGKLSDGKRTSLLALIKSIEEDRLYLDHSRQKVLLMREFLQHAQFGRYMSALYEYLVNPHDFMDEGNGHKLRGMPLQRWRGSLLETLKMRDEPKRTPREVRASMKGMADWWIEQNARHPFIKLTECQKAGRAIDFLILQMQDLYADITSEYLRLRVELLSPIGIDLSGAPRPVDPTIEPKRRSGIPSWLRMGRRAR
jgi:hypothetical protein